MTLGTILLSLAWFVVAVAGLTLLYKAANADAESEAQRQEAADQDEVEAFLDDALFRAAIVHDMYKGKRWLDVDAMVARAFVQSFPTNATTAQIDKALDNRQAMRRDDARTADKVIARIGSKGGAA